MTEKNPQLIAAQQALKQARKFLKATVKEAKKQKPLLGASAGQP
jgi:hypothetical protein